MRNEWKRIDRPFVPLWYTSYILTSRLFLYDTLAAMHAPVPRNVQADRINAHFPRSTADMLAFRCCRGCDSRLTCWRNSVRSIAIHTHKPLCNPVSKFSRVDASSSDNGVTRATWRLWLIFSIYPTYPSPFPSRTSFPSIDRGNTGKIDKRDKSGKKLAPFPKLLSKDIPSRIYPVSA